MLVAQLVSFTAKLRNRHLFVLDAILAVSATVIAFGLRFEGFAFPPDVARLLGLYTIVALVLKLATFYSFGLYRGLWRYASLAEVERIFLAGTVAGLACVVLGAVILPGFNATSGRVPLSILALDVAATIGVATLPRLLMRFAGAYAIGGTGQKRRAVVVGAGAAGQAILRESRSAAKGEVAIVAFVDDNPGKQGLHLGGLSVVGSTKDIGEVVKRFAAQEVIIAIPNAPGPLVRRIVQDAKEAGVTTRIVPALREILAGNLTVSKLRKVEIEDLLRRDPVRTDMHKVRSLADGKSVLVTGGGGSIGSELCRQIAELSPERLVVLDHSENAVFNILGELRRVLPNIEIVPVIADIRNAVRIRHVFDRCKPTAVFHAAAHKHVPLMEDNIYEAVTNNVLGTRNIVDAALDSGVERLVLISSDKAVRPTSIMGATKRVAEQLVHHAAITENRNFVSVRFGNVLGSSGSVVPIFLEQIKAGGPVTVTHPEMRRYFMTIPEAVQLVLQAGAMGTGGELFVLDMGEPVKVSDMARDLIRLSGYAEDEIEIEYTGVRPGEKLYEEIFREGEDATGTEHPKVLRARPDVVSAEVVERIEALVRAVFGGSDDAALRELLHNLVPDFSRYDARTVPNTRPAPHAAKVTAPERTAGA